MAGRARPRRRSRGLRRHGEDPRPLPAEARAGHARRRRPLLPRTAARPRSGRQSVHSAKSQVGLISSGRFPQEVCHMRNRILAALLACAALPAMAKDVDVSCTGCQDAFDVVAEDLVATVDYKATGPAEATGLTGFGVGAFATYTSVGNEWQTVTGSDFSGIGLAGLQVTKGLPFDIDLGAFYSSAPGTNVKAYGVQVRYALLPGSTVSPAVALGASYSKV